MMNYSIFAHLVASIAFLMPESALLQADDLRSPIDGVSLRTEWIAETDRNPLDFLDIRYMNQAGDEGVLKSLIDRPTVVTFFYTRCQNNYKCSAALMRFTALQRKLRQLKLDGHVRMLAITYEPGFDDASRLRRFGANRGLTFTETAQLLRLDEQRHAGFLRAVKAPVSLSGGAVNTHGVALNILDSKGRVVRQYHTLLWDNEQVVQDVQKLLVEKKR